MFEEKLAELEIELVLLTDTLNSNRGVIKDTKKELEECLRISERLLYESEEEEDDVSMLATQAPPSNELESPRSPVESPASPIPELNAPHSPVCAIEIPSSPRYVIQQEAHQEVQIEEGNQFESPKSPIDAVEQEAPSSANMDDLEASQLAKHAQMQQTNSLPANAIDLESPLSPQIVNDQESPFSPIIQNETDIISTAMELSFIFVNCDEEKDSVSPTDDPNESPKSPEPEQENVEQENGESPIPPVYMYYNEQTPLSTSYYSRSPANKSNQAATTPKDYQFYATYNQQCPALPENILEQDESPLSPLEQEDLTVRVDEPEGNMLAVPQNVEIDQESPFSPIDQNENEVVDHYEPEIEVSNTVSIINGDYQESPLSPQNEQVESFTIDAAPPTTNDICVDQVEQESPFSPINPEDTRPSADILEQEIQYEFEPEVEKSTCMDYVEENLSSQHDVPIENSVENQPEIVIEQETPSLQLCNVIELEVTNLTAAPICITHNEQIENYIETQPFEQETHEPGFERESFQNDGQDAIEQQNVPQVETLGLEESTPICMDHNEQHAIEQNEPLGLEESAPISICMDQDDQNANEQNVPLGFEESAPIPICITHNEQHAIEQDVPQNQPLILEELTPTPIYITHNEQDAVEQNVPLGFEESAPICITHNEQHANEQNEPLGLEESAPTPICMDHDAIEQQNEPLGLKESAPMCITHSEQDVLQANQVARESPFSPISVDNPQSPADIVEQEIRYEFEPEANESNAISNETQQAVQIDQETQHAVQIDQGTQHDVQIDQEITPLITAPVFVVRVEQGTQTDFQIEEFLLPVRNEKIEKETQSDVQIEQQSVIESQPLEQETPKEVQIEPEAPLLAQPDQIEQETPKEDQVESLSTYPFEQESLESEVTKPAMAPSCMNFFEQEVGEETRIESPPTETESKDASLPNMDEINVEYNQTPMMSENTVEISLFPANAVEQDESLPFEQEVSLPAQNEQTNQEVQQQVESSITASFEQESRETEVNSGVTVSISMEIIERENATVIIPTLPEREITESPANAVEQETTESPANAVEQETTESPTKAITCKRCKKLPVLAKMLCSRCYLRKNQSDKKLYMKYVEKKLIEECRKAGKQKRVDPNSLNYNEKEKFRALTAEFKNEAKRIAREKARKTRLRRKLRKLRAAGAGQKRILSTIERFNNPASPSKRQKRFKSKNKKPKSSDKQSLKQKPVVSAASDQQARQPSSSKTPKPAGPKAKPKPKKAKKVKKQKQPATSNRNSNLSASDRARELEEREIIRNFKLDTPGVVHPPSGSIANCRDCDKKSVMRSAGRCTKCMNDYYHAKRLASKQKCVRCKKITTILAHK